MTLDEIIFEYENEHNCKLAEHEIEMALTIAHHYGNSSEVRKNIERKFLERIVSAGFLDTSHDIGLQVACEQGSDVALIYINGSGS